MQSFWKQVHAIFSTFPGANHDTGATEIDTITMYEVFKVVLRATGENEALQSIAAMQKGSDVDLTTGIAMNASNLSLQHNLSLADSIILATAKGYKCIIWTQDSDFENLKRVKFFPKKNIDKGAISKLEIANCDIKFRLGWQT